MHTVSPSYPASADKNRRADSALLRGLSARSNGGAGSDGPCLGDGAYYQPNDDRQAKAGSIEYVLDGPPARSPVCRMSGTDMPDRERHHVWLLTLRDALFLAPLQDPQRVLDVGTGTGLWAVDMGDRYPSCEVVGTDLSPTQVPYAPPNVRFEIDDCCSEWTYPENSFDLIHVRGLTGSVGSWPKFYQECLKYGGDVSLVSLGLFQANSRFVHFVSRFLLFLLWF